MQNFECSNLHKLLCSHQLSMRRSHPPLDDPSISGNVHLWQERICLRRLYHLSLVGISAKSFPDWVFTPDKLMAARLEGGRRGARFMQRLKFCVQKVKSPDSSHCLKISGCSKTAVIMFIAPVRFRIMAVPSLGVRRSFL